jgi:ribose 5-phosphate isomerase A
LKSTSSNSEQKKAVGIKAADLVKDGMSIGIGTGSTVAFFIEELGARVKQGLGIQAVPTSSQSKLLCSSYGIPILDASMVDHLDMAIDGADEIDGDLNAIKGGGAAQTIEKIIASMADEFVLIADESKLKDRLCGHFPLPVEVIPVGCASVIKQIKQLGGEPDIRMAVRKDGPVITENGNYIMDITFNTPPKDLFLLNRQLLEIPGIVETGLFLGLAKRALIAGAQGVREIKKKA